jgi:organic hydroperoxide reductase OsmC/OhrA
MRENARIGAWIGTKEQFRSAVQRDPVLREQAQKRLGELTDAVTMKCFISRSHREALEEALRDG